MQYCTGDAKKVIRSCVTMEPSAGYQAARKLMKERFGHPYTIAAAHVRTGTGTEGAPLMASDHAGLLALSDQLKDYENTFKSIGYLDEINSADNFKKMVEASVSPQSQVVGQGRHHPGIW